jgi:hypothetical protein
MQFFTKKRVIATVAAAAVLSAGVGAAFAYWTDNGAGSSTAMTGTSTPFTVTVSSVGINPPLVPGGASDGYTFNVKNVGSGNQQAGTATVTVANSDGSVWTSVPGCSAADYTISAVTFTAATLAPNASANGSFTLAMNNTGVSQDGCKNASVPLYVKVN